MSGQDDQKVFMIFMFFWFECNVWIFWGMGSFVGMRM